MEKIKFKLQSIKEKVSSVQCKHTLYYLYLYVRLYKFILVKLIAVGVLLIFPISLFASTKQQETDILDKKVTFRAGSYTASNLLDLLSLKAKAPIGFEEIPCEEERKITINITSGKVREILDEFVREDKRYKWVKIKNVINVMPKDTRDSVLDVKISVFSFTNIDIDDARIAILESYELKTKLAALNLIGSNSTDYDGPLRDMSQFSIDLSNVTVRDILNEVLRQGRNRYWKAYRYGDNNKYFTIWFLTFSPI